jgi:uncharacterized protein (DUF983 family)
MTIKQTCRHDYFSHNYYRKNSMNVLSSIIKCKCPKCRQGDLFVKPLVIKNFLTMPEQCNHCGQKTMPEPGFYYGAMFMSYIITAFLYLGIVGSLILGLGFSVEAAFGVLLLFVIATYIHTARLSRSLWIHLMVSYNP